MSDEGKKKGFFDRLTSVVRNKEDPVEQNTISLYNKEEIDIDRFIEENNLSKDTIDNTVEKNSYLTDLSSVIYYYMGDTYYDYERLKQILSSPGKNPYGTCMIIDSLYDENGFYSGELVKNSSAPKIVPIVSPIKNGTNEDKDDFYEFMIDIDANGAARESLVDTGKYSVHFAYLEYQRKGNSNKRLIRLNPKYCRVIGNDGISSIIGIDMFKSYTKDVVSTFPKSIRDRMDKERKRLSDKKNNVGDDSVANSEDYLYLKNQYLKLDPNRTITIISGGTKSDEWGSILLLKSLKDMITDYGLQKKIKSAIESGEKNIVYSSLAGNSPGDNRVSRPRQVSTGARGAKDTHDLVKTAVASESRVATVTLPNGNELKLLNIKDSFAQYNSENIMARIAFYSGVPLTMINGKAEGKAIENYTKNQLNVYHVNLEKFASQLNRVYHAYRDKREMVAYLEYPKLNDYTIKQNADINEKVFTSAGGSFEHYLANTGSNPYSAIRSMKNERDNKYDETFKPHLTSNNISKNDETTNRSRDNEKVEEDET